MSDFINRIVGDLGDKKRWKEYRTRVAALPDGYRTAVEVLERYLMRAGAQGYDASVQIWEDLVDLFERAAADATPIHDIVGDDPVGFADTFSANYGTKDWRTKERKRLVDGIARAEQQGPRSSKAPE